MADEDLTLQQLTGAVMALQSLVGALLISLTRKQTLSLDEVKDTYEQALMHLEESRGALPAVTVSIDAGRAYLEAQIRTLSARR